MCSYCFSALLLGYLYTDNGSPFCSIVMGRTLMLGFTSDGPVRSYKGYPSNISSDSNVLTLSFVAPTPIDENELSRLRSEQEDLIASHNLIEERMFNPELGTTEDIKYFAVQLNETLSSLKSVTRRRAELEGMARFGPLIDGNLVVDSIDLRAGCFTTITEQMLHPLSAASSTPIPELENERGVLKLTWIPLVEDAPVVTLKEYNESFVCV